MPQPRRTVLAVLAVLASICSQGRGATAARAEITAGSRRVSLDQDWRFVKADPPSAEQPDFDDGAWQPLDVPHDWAIAGPFDRANGPEAGALPFFGVGWYRKHFTMADGLRGRHVTVEFDGAMANSRVWFNGHELGARPYGYISFGYDLTPFLQFGGHDNVLAVRLAPEPHSSRWYPGAGLYRHVHLGVTDPVHVGRWGTFVTTSGINDAAATVHIRVQVRNDGTGPEHVDVETTFLNADGSTAGRVAAVSATVAAGAESAVEASGELPHPHRWDVDDPYLYRAVTTIRTGRGVADSIRDGVRPPHAGVRCRLGVLAERPSPEAARGVPAPRPGTARHGGVAPRDRAAAVHDEGDGRQCREDQSQPARTRAARGGRRDGAARHRRGLRHVEPHESAEWPRQVLRPVGRA